MVGLSTAKKWNLKEFKFTCGDATDPGKVTKIECVVCSEFYHENEKELGKLQGKVKAQVQKWMSGSDIVKKSNAVDHLKSNAHATTVKRLREKRSSTGRQKVKKSQQQPARAKRQLSNTFVFCL